MSKLTFILSVANLIAACFYSREEVAYWALLVMSAIWACSTVILKAISHDRK